MWNFRYFDLPYDHGFIYSVRGLVDGYFKILGWLVITATFQIIAETSHSALIWAICIIAYVMVLFYIQAFINWLSHMRRRGSDRAMRDLGRGKTSKNRFVRRLSAAATAAAGLLMWFAIIFFVQQAIDRTVTAIVEIQRTKAK
ncbi:hypothetical protein A1D31_11830 [Bradyrhizobium liaoningense]|nr:hypothetical protein A1D31_11830 [Bradyrhizobium liaoningense]